MHMRDQEERRFAVSIKHDKNYQFVSQASEDGRVHGGPFRSDEPDPVGDDAGPATPALLGAALGHCLSASLLETLKRSRLDVRAFETEAVAVVKPNAEGLPRIDHVDVVLKPVLSARSPRTARAEEVFENHCTVTSSVKRGIDVRVRVEWVYEEQPADATA
jgi:organic hydroperoxide reductase OsmC/OhrA